MTLDEYAAWAGEVARIPAGGTMDRERLSYLALGLTGEAGEVADLIKKLLRDGDSAWRPERLAEELGDVIYSWSAMCAAIGRSPSDLLAASRAKIEAKLAKRG
ncbi:MAG: nucleoside triphosphate pyrophosphohydrolase family protein [Dongiaceae bacterium]